MQNLPVNKVDKGKASVLASVSVIGNVHPADGSKGTEQLLHSTLTHEQCDHQANS